MKVLIHEYIDKIENFDKLPFTEQVKYLAYCYVKNTKDELFTPRNIKDFFELANLQEPANVNDIFIKLCDRKNPIFLKRSSNFTFQRSAFNKIEEEFSISKPKQITSANLRMLLKKIKNDDEARFLEEAINCYEIGSYRASIIMTWLLVMSNLQNYIFTKKLSEFNSALTLQRIRNINTTDDFSELKESKFIEICRSASIISNDIRKILDEKLGIRNTYAHPNGIQISESRATSFIEDLIQNVFLKFNP